MVIPTITSVGIGCPSCGYVDIYQLSMFIFSSHQSLTINCRCGSKIFNLSTRNYKQFWVKIKCPFCYQMHVFALSRSQIWTSKMLLLYCKITGKQIAVIGSEKKIVAYLNPIKINIRENGDKISLEDKQTLLRYEMIEKLGTLIKKGKLACPCGKTDLEIEIFKNRIHLYCSCCGAWNELNMFSRGDLERLLSLKIILAPHSSKFI